MYREDVVQHRVWLDKKLVQLWQAAKSFVHLIPSGAQEVDPDMQRLAGQ